MGWYDPPDDLPTERVYFEYAGLELDAVLQILAFKDDNLEELVNENLVEEFSIDFTDLYDLEAGIYEDSIQVIQEYPDGKVLYQCDATIHAACADFEWDCTVNVFRETDPNGEIEDTLVPYNYKAKRSEPTEFDGQDIIDPKCKFIKVPKLVYVPGSFDKDYYRH